MVKKKLDSRIRTLIENGVAQRHRSLFVIVGDRGRDQVVNLHHILSKARVRTRPNVLWCYKSDLGFTSNRQKRAAKLKKDVARGIRQVDEENPFEIFVGATDIRYTYYKETDKVLGQTFGMCVLQDFQALTPNILARTIETVEGGGIIVLLVKTISSLRQLYTMTMDVHSRYRTDNRQKVVGRFNERFMLSLAMCRSCLVVDDELNVLPISAHVNDIHKVSFDTKGSRPVEFDDDHALTEKEIELRELKSSLRDTVPIGPLIGLARTLDQAKGVLTFAEAVAEKSLKATVALLAARGRGKSASLGLALAGAVAYGYSNCFVTAPSPENLRTLFSMAVEGFKALGYKEHVDFELVESTDPRLNRAPVRLNVFRSHRQTIQYIAPEDHTRLAQAELLVIDEAAAIPLPVVTRLIGPYLVFLSSTVNGYEGTGRALSLKLLRQLREQTTAALHTALSQNNATVKAAAAAAATSTALTVGSSTAGNAAIAANLRGRTLREVTLTEPIRYGEGDLVEKWLNNLLCLDCASQVPRLTRSPSTPGGGVPHPSSCQLYYINRDTLFSAHKASESFLQRMMSLYVSSHYKNSPNDLQAMSDAPGQHLFALLGPVSETTALPDLLCVVQVALEGAITRTRYISQSVNGVAPTTDVIPWCVSQQYQLPEFASLSGARIVRIAVHPELQRMGYGSRAVQLLSDYYEEKMTSLAEDEDDEDPDALATTEVGVVDDDDLDATTRAAGGTAALHTESTIAPRRNLPPLLSELSERRPEPLHWLGASFGLTGELLSFFAKNSFVPVYVRPTANDVTGEHTVVMVRPQLGSAAILAAAEKGIAHGDTASLLGSAAQAAAEANAAAAKSSALASGVRADAPLWLQAVSSDFRRRFASLLGFDFRVLPATLALGVLRDPTEAEEAHAARVAAAGPALGSIDDEDEEDEGEGAGAASSAMLGDELTAAEMSVLIGQFDLRRLEVYSKQLIDHHLILDLTPALARLYFSGRIHVPLTRVQSAILIAVGLQHKPLGTLEGELGVGRTQTMALFNKTVRKFTAYLRGVEEAELAKEVRAKTSAGRAMLAKLPSASAAVAAVGVGSISEKLAAAGKGAQSELKKKQAALLESLRLDNYTVSGTDAEWEAAASELAAGAFTGKTVSVRADSSKAEAKQKARDAGTPAEKKRNALAKKRAAATTGKTGDIRKKARQMDDD